jgi:hypothetical protein
MRTMSAMIIKRLFAPAALRAPGAGAGQPSFNRVYRCVHHGGRRSPDRCVAHRPGKVRGTAVRRKVVVRPEVCAALPGSAPRYRCA